MVDCVRQCEVVNDHLIKDSNNYRKQKIDNINDYILVIKPNDEKKNDNNSNKKQQ